tara:strand:- start:382 stop:672 length:291 start_codon:yes stop_codon:yes gene_type:complete
MPKGQTSRPYNRKEKQALATKKNVRAASNTMSSTNLRTVLDSKRVTSAHVTLGKNKTKEANRKTGVTLGRAGITRQTDPTLFSTDGKGKKSKPKKK